MDIHTASVEIIGDKNVENKKIISSYKSPSLYAVNIISLGIFILLIVAFDIGIVATKKTGFFCKDPFLSHKVVDDTVHPVTLNLVHVLVPPLLFYIVEYLGGCKQRSFGDFRFVWSWYFDFIVGYLLTLVMIHTCKALIDSPRPHFFDTCLPDANENCTVGTFVTNYECTNRNSSRALLLEAMTSFPSGHASLSTFSSIYCATYIIVRLKKKCLEKVVKPSIVTIFVFWGLAVPLTRIADHRQHWWDVLTGCFLGSLFAIYTIKCLSMCFKSPQKEPKKSGSDTILLQ